MVPLILSQNKDVSDVHQLKQEFIESLATFSKPSETLRCLVQRLLSAGHSRKDLIQWAVDAGYAQQYVRSLLSAVLVKAGVRARKTGAGRRTSQEALIIAAYAAGHFGSDAPKHLLAAYRHLKQKATNSKSTEAAAS